MKNILLLLFFCISFISAHSQNISVEFNHSPIKACSDNEISIEVNFSAATQTYASNLYLAIDLGAHLPAGVVDPTNYQIIYNDATPNNLVENDPGPRYVYVDLGSNQFSAGTIVRTITFRLGCESIRDNSNITTNQDDIYITVGKTLSTSLPLSEWSLQVIATPAPPSNVVTPAINSRLFNYYLNYAFINNGTSINLGVNYINWQSGNVIRTITYDVSTTSATPNLTYNLLLNFEELFYCNKANITQMEIFIESLGGTPLSIYSLAANVSNSIATVGNIAVQLKDGDVIRVVEEFEYPHYTDNCIIVDCNTSPSQPVLLKSYLHWGCEDYDFTGTVINSNLCNEIEVNNAVENGRLEPNITISRTAPQPFSTAVPSYWDNTFIDGGATRWEYLVENTGVDAVKNLTINIQQDENLLSSFYFLNENDIKVYPPGSVLAIPSTTTRLYSLFIPQPGPQPSCLLANPNALQFASYVIGELLPGSSVRGIHPTNYT